MNNASPKGLLLQCPPALEKLRQLLLLGNVGEETSYVSMDRVTHDPLEITRHATHIGLEFSISLTENNRPVFFRIRHIWIRKMIRHMPTKSLIVGCRHYETL